MPTKVIIIIMLVTYVLGAITKAFVVKIPNRFIPFQNCLIGLISAIFCTVLKLEPNFWESLVLCLMATMSAGGTAELIKTLKNQPNVTN